MMACVKCGTFLKIKRNGVSVEEGRRLNGDAWGPYKLWMADLYGCESCGAEIATTGLHPVSEHYKADYSDMRSKFPPVVVVNDCTGIFRGQR